MTNEGDPTVNIVDVDTFRYYVVGFRSTMLENKPRKRSPDSKIIRSIFPDSDPSVLVRLRGIRWDDIPESLQQVLSMQYDSASLPIEKTVDIELSDATTILLRLNSPTIFGFSDAFGETLVWPGVTLNLADTAKSKKGKWAITKMPNRISGQIDKGFQEGSMTQLNEEGKSLQREMRAFNQRKPAVLDELRDLARLMEKSKDKVEIEEI